MALGYIVSMMAGLAPMNRLLQGFMKLLTFPVQQLPEVFHRTTITSFVSWFVCSLLIAALLVLVFFAVHKMLGAHASLTFALVLALGFVGCGFYLGRTVDEWSRTGHRYLQNYYLFLPVPFRESEAEKYSQQAIRDQLAPDQPLVLTTNQWYWNYRSGLSGSPSYDGIVVGAEAASFPALEKFLDEFTAQRDPTLRAASWQDVTETGRWVMQTAMPNRAPLPSTEKDRVIRIYAKAPSSGVWLGILAREKKLPRDKMISILEAAMASVTPMSKD
jgi:hypothetical protein